MKPFWMKELLRDREDEGGGGGPYDNGEGVSDSGPAPSRNDALEDKVNKLTDAFTGFVQRDEKQQHDNSSAKSENAIRAAIGKGNRELDDAEGALAAAFDEGDGVVIAKAQRTVSEKAARLERINAAVDQHRMEQKAAERRPPQPVADDLDTSNLDGWKNKHSSWYGVDKEMTKAAHELDATIRTNGVLQSGSKEYFDAIDRQMRQKFPDHFSGTAPTGGNSGGDGGPSSVPGQTRIPASIADGYRRMGINVDDPAVAKRMIDNRAKAVQKGWLPAKADLGRVLTR